MAFGNLVGVSERRMRRMLLDGGRSFTLVTPEGSSRKAFIAVATNNMFVTSYITAVWRAYFDMDITNKTTCKFRKENKINKVFGVR